MRPPMQSAALQQNEGQRQQQLHHQQQQQHQQQKLHTDNTTAILTPDTIQQQEQQLITHKAKLQQQQRDIFVENQLNVACSATAAAANAVTTTAVTYHKQKLNFLRSRTENSLTHDGLGYTIDNDSIQLVDLSTSPPSTPRAQSIQLPLPPPRASQQQHSVLLKRFSSSSAGGAITNTNTSTQRSSVTSQFSRSSSSDDCSLSYTTAATTTRANTFEDAAENFIINFPADSSSLHNNQNQNIVDSTTISLPLSETEPLLTNIEATVADTQRSICLNKNSGASLIFTKKELGRSHSSGANNNRRQHNQRRQQQQPHQQQSYYQTRKQTKHLPPTYHNQNQQQPQQHQQSQQQQRRSLQLNYNNNLVTTSTCGANNNYCCTTSNVGTATPAAKSDSVALGKSVGGAVLHKHHHHSNGLTSPIANKPTIAAATSVTSAATRKQHSYSWYAPVYSALEEELEQDSRDSSPIHNLAQTKQQHASNRYQQRASYKSSIIADNETDALLETRNKINIEAQLHAPARDTVAGGVGGLLGLQQRRRTLGSTSSSSSVPSTVPPNTLNLLTISASTGSGSNNGAGSVEFSGANTLTSSYDAEGPHAGSLGLAGGPLPRRRRFENFLKSLVGLKTTSNGGSNHSSSTSTASRSTTTNSDASSNTVQLRRPASPEIRITRTPSERNMLVLSHHPAGNYDEHHSSEKLANGVIGSGSSTSSLNVMQQKLWNIMRREGSATSLNQEKSHSIVQYTGLRKCETVLALTRQTNSLCSPVLSNGPDLIDSSNVAHNGSGIFSASGVEQIRPLNRLRNSVGSINGAATCSRCSSLLSLAATGGSRYSLNIAAHSGANNTLPTSTSQQQLRQYQPQQQQRYQRQQQTMRSLSSQSAQQQQTRNLSCSNLMTYRQDRNRSSDEFDDVVDGNGNDNSNGNKDANKDTDNIGRIGCGSNSSCGSRKSSAGANSSNSTSSICPPSNVTTATLSTNSTNSHTINNINDNNKLSPQVATTPTNISINALTSSSSPTAAELLESLGTTHSYPITVNSLLSMTAVNGAAAAGAADAAATPYDTMMCVGTTDATATTAATTALPFSMFTCKLCLIDVETADEATTLIQCGCHFCTECMRAYVEFEISEGAYDISCPDAQCPAQGVVTLQEIAKLTTANLMKKHHRYRLNREIELDKSRTWCPRAGCETVCLVSTQQSNSEHSDATPSTSTSLSASLTPTTTEAGGSLYCAVQCPSCKDEFCSSCKKPWHVNISCEENSRRLVADGQDDIGIPFDNDLIKCCPMCAVPIEKDEGCAQMMCKRCKHVFCWYCLASLDDDFLLRHYDKGPCKNKLGHSRASVVWHRAQVIGIFAGFGILLLVASPLLLLAAPCIICCKCRSCSGSKIDEVDGDLDDEATALQS